VYVCEVSRHDTWMKTTRRKIVSSPGMAKGDDARDPTVLECGHLQIAAFCHAAGIPLTPDSAFSARCGSVQLGRMKWQV
jgi:hypothetical protein